MDAMKTVKQKKGFHVIIIAANNGVIAKKIFVHKIANNVMKMVIVFYVRKVISLKEQNVNKINRLFVLKDVNLALHKIIAKFVINHIT